MSIFKISEKKSMDCAAETGADGVVHLSCRRQIRQKNGERVYDGQQVEAFIDPSGCTPVVSRGVIDDDERQVFEEQLKKFASSCRRKISTGVSKG